MWLGISAHRHEVRDIEVRHDEPDEQHQGGQVHHQEVELGEHVEVERLVDHVEEPSAPRLEEILNYRTCPYLKIIL